MNEQLTTAADRIREAAAVLVCVIAAMPQDAHGAAGADFGAALAVVSRLLLEAQDASERGAARVSD